MATDHRMARGQPDHERYYSCEKPNALRRYGQAVQKGAEGRYKQVAHEVARSAQEPVPRSESLLGPHIQAAFSGYRLESPATTRAEGMEKTANLPRPTT